MGETALPRNFRGFAGIPLCGDRGVPMALSKELSLERDRVISQRRPMRNPFKYFKTSPGLIRLAVMMYIRFPLSLRDVEDRLHELGIDITDETARFCWNRFGPRFAAQIR
jgi:hypothetical protein